MPGRFVENESEIDSLRLDAEDERVGPRADQVADVSLALDRREQVERRQLELDGDLGHAFGSRLPVRR